MRARSLLLLLLPTLAAGAAGLYVAGYGRAGPAPYRMARVERGLLTATVSATGTLNAVTTVQVGSQISGQISALFADFNSRVSRGQVIARIDPATFEAKVTQAKADLDAARAAVLNQEAAVARAEAELESARATLAVVRAQTAKARVALLDAKRDLDRKRALFAERLIPQSDRDSAEAAHDSAAAQLEASQGQEQAQASVIRAQEAALRVAEAQLRAAQAQVAQKAAALRQAEVDLAHTIIRAPVDGVVISRNVDVGQTVAASLQAPTLFTIAQDLTRMQVDTSVDEADVGRVRLGQPASFTVDAFPGRTFTGEVVQIRKAAQVVQNVVTYDVVISAQNPDLTLLPGMTANVRIVVARKENVLTVPNAALRFRPPGVASGRPSAEGRAPGRAGDRQGPAGGGPLRPDGDTGPAAARGRARAGLAGTVWVPGDDGRPRPVAVELGISDGSSTEVVAGGLAEGQAVIVGSAEPSPARPPAAGPFRMPRL